MVWECNINLLVAAEQPHEAATSYATSRGDRSFCKPFGAPTPIPPFGANPTPLKTPAKFNNFVDGHQSPLAQVANRRRAPPAARHPQRTTKLLVSGGCLVAATVMHAGVSRAGEAGRDHLIPPRGGILIY